MAVAPGQSSTAIPPRTGVAQYEGIACPAARVCYVTGFHGTVLFTRDGGQQWRVMRVDSLEDLGGLACAGILVCHVLGPSSAILSTTDGGRDWHDYTRGTKDELVAITCPTSTDCRAMAPSGLLLVTDNGGRTWTSRPSLLHSNLGFPLPGLACPTVLICYVAGEKGTIDRTVDLGTTWQTLSNPFSRTALALAGIACPSASVCYTAGSGCLVAGCYGPDSRVVALGTTDGGRIWHTLYDQRASDLARPADAILEAIACPTVTVCYLAGSPGLVIETRDGGRTWDDRHSPATGSNLELSGITCPAASVCDAVGTGCRGGSFGCTIGGFAGTVLTTRNGGRSWHRYESGRTVLTAGECGSAGVCLTGVNLHGIACSSVADCRTVGGDGTVLATTNGGKTWHAETTPTNNALLGIACPRPGACLTVGGGGTILGTGPAGRSASIRQPSRGQFHEDQRTISARMFYEQAIARLLAQKRFELSETLHDGVRSQPQRYHLRLHLIAPDRLSAERDDLPNIGIQVGGVTCHGPRRWHCQHATFPSMDATVHAFVLPEPPLTHVTFKVTETPTTEVITIRAEGDPWQCPPFAVTCFTPSFDETAFQARSRYAGTLIVDRRTGLPRSLTSQVTMGFDTRRISSALRRNLVSPAQQITFTYGGSFTITLPHYPTWKCPWWDPPGTWCMKEPGA